MRRSSLTLVSAVAAAGLLAASAVGTFAQESISIDAASVPITIDGDASDWSEVEGTSITLEQIRLDGLSAADAEEIDIGIVEPIEVVFKVASDADNIYMLLEVPTPYHYVADDHGLSPALAVQARIDTDASTHMGAEEADSIASTGMVDIWHWELDCGPGEMSGSQAVADSDGGNDACNFDDEYSTTPEMREDDGGGDVENVAAENSLLGSWSHTAAEIGGEGTCTFEMARPLNTGDPQDAQWEAGGSAALVLAWWDPKETSEGWTDAGHLSNAYDGWIEVALN